MKRIFSLVISVVMLMCMFMTASAEYVQQNYAKEVASPYYLYTDSISSTLDIADKTATCKSTIWGIPGTTTKIVVTQYLQKREGSVWYNQYSWTKTCSTWYALFTNSVSSISSGAYRIKTVAKVYSGTDYETLTAFSKTKTC